MLREADLAVIALRSLPRAESTGLGGSFRVIGIAADSQLIPGIAMFEVVLSTVGVLGR
jgi:hypothetical protein